MKKGLLVLIILIAISILPKSSEASIGLIGNATLGDFRGTMSYMAHTAYYATLQIELTNISPAQNGGYLTAFAFNNPENKITGVTLYTDSNLKLLFGNDQINASPYGYFDIGAALSSNLDNGFLGGGNPSFGIGVGEARQFTFSFYGTDLDTISEYSFIKELSSNPGGEGSEFIIARFRGFEDGGNNKTPGDVVPEPATLAMFGIGMLGFGIFKRKRIKIDQRQ